MDSHFSASFLERGPPRPRPYLANGGICLPFTNEGLCSFSPPSTFSACKAVMHGIGNNSNPKKIIEKLHVNWGHASAQQIKRVLVAADGGNLPLLRHVEEVVNQCEVCRAFDKAPHFPIAGTATVSAFNEKVQVGHLIAKAFNEQAFNEKVSRRSHCGACDRCFFEVLSPSPGAIQTSPGSLGRFLRGMAGDIWPP